MRNIFMGVLLLYACSVQAEIYKCVGADGKINFTDSPCSAGTAAERVELPPVPETPYQRQMRELKERHEKHVQEMAELEAQAKERSRLRWHKFYARQQGEGLSIGMPSNAVEALPNWGVPDDANVTTTANGTREQWIYRTDDEDEFKRVYLYFEAGRLVAIQH